MLSLEVEKNIYSKYEKEGIEALNGVKEKYRENKLGFIDLDKKNDLERIFEFVKKNQKKYDFLLVLGIGGSALGIKAVLESLKGKYYNELYKPQIFVCDNVDSYEIDDILNIIELKKTLFFVISKSGGTLETLSTYEFFKGKILDEKLELKNHFSFITEENSKLDKQGEKENISCFYLDKNVGGRFSVLSNVGLLPLAFCGINIKKLLNGQKNYKNKFLSENLEENLALQSAILQFDAYKKEKNITVFFPYLANFKNFGAWYKQLFGESLGKSEIPANLFTSIGTTDQHSDLQLFIEGKNDKLFIFLELLNFKKDFKVFKKQKIYFSDILKLSKYGTQKSLVEKNRLNYTIKLEKLNEKTIGALILFFEFQIAFLGELLEINAYNQPGVENSKKITKQKIEEKFGNIL